MVDLGEIPEASSMASFLFAYWCSLARPARTLPVLPDVSPALPAVERGRCAGCDSSSIGRRPERARRAGPLRVLHRRYLCEYQKGGGSVGKTKRGKGTKLMVLADASGLPLGVHAVSASPHEVTLVEATLATSCAGEEPERLIGDRAYDSDPLDEALKERSIEMIAPHRRNRKKPRTQDGRTLRRYKRRWKIERLFAWLGNF